MYPIYYKGQANRHYTTIDLKKRGGGGSGGVDETLLVVHMT